MRLGDGRWCKNLGKLRISDDGLKDVSLERGSIFQAGDGIYLLRQ